MFILQGIITGIIATLIFDFYQYSLSYAYNLNKPNWHLFGRYILGLKKQIYINENINSKNPIKNEFVIGLFFHYIIGLIFGVFYVTINILIYNQPSILIALIIGFITVLGGWCIMMPFVYDMGFFCSKKEERKQILVQNLLAHFIFGIGLFIGYTSIN